MPFFAVMSVQPPHDRYVAPPEFTKGHTPNGVKFLPNVPDVKWVRDEAGMELAGYYAMVENVDFNVGRIVNKLNETKLIDNTHIVFFSDHGDMHGSHGQFRKTTPYQEATHVPFIISGEQSAANVVARRSGNVKNVLINHVDIAPTTLGLCDIDVPDWMQGCDYSTVRKLDKPAKKYPQSLYMQCVIPTGHGDSVNKAWRGIVTVDGYKYVCFEQHSKFDVLRHRLNGELQDWIIKTNDSFILPK